LKLAWSNMWFAHSRMVLNTCAKSFQNVTNPLRVKKRTHNTAIQCLTLNYNLDHEQTLVIETQCSSTYHTWHLCNNIWKSHQRFKRYGADTKSSHTCLTLNFDLNLEPALVKHIHCTSTSILDVCAEVFENPTRGSKDIKGHESVTDGQTDRRTDGRTNRQRSYTQYVTPLHEGARPNERTHERTHARTNEQTNKQTNECMHKRMNETSTCSVYRQDA